MIVSCMFLRRFNTAFPFKLLVRVGVVQEEQWIKSQNMLSLTQVGLLAGCGLSACHILM